MEIVERGCQTFAYVRGVECDVSLGDELRGRFWFSHFGQQSLCSFAIAPAAAGSIGRRGDLLTHLCLTGHDEL